MILTTYKDCNYFLTNGGDGYPFCASINTRVLFVKKKYSLILHTQLLYFIYFFGVYLRVLKLFVMVIYRCILRVISL